MIHASSLILDDLPSMDDAAAAARHPTLHREFGEDLAILCCGRPAQPRLRLGHRDPRRPHSAAGGRCSRSSSASSTPWAGTARWPVRPSTCTAKSRSSTSTPSNSSIRERPARCSSPPPRSEECSPNAHPTVLQRHRSLCQEPRPRLPDHRRHPRRDLERRHALGKDVGKDEQRLTFVKLAGVEGARKLSQELVDTSMTAIEGLGAATKPLRELAVMVRDRVR